MASFSDHYSKPRYVDTNETGNWNVAKEYTQRMIMDPIDEIKEYKKIAKYGCQDLIEEFQLTPSDISSSRVKALDRMLFTLNLLMENTQFAINKFDQPKFTVYMEELDKLRKFLPLVSSKIKDNRTHMVSLKINEEAFGILFDRLCKISTEILTPLNKSDLIFNSVEEFDPAKFKQKIMTQIVEGG